MPDSPDYQKYLPSSNRFSLSDMGELAVRLGSLNVFDRRGEIIWYDDFRYGQIGWTSTTPGGTASVGLGVRSSFLSPYCLRMLDSLVGTRVLSTSKSVSANASGRIGIELCFRLTSYFDTFNLQLSFSTVEYSITSKIRLTDSGYTIGLWNNSQAYETINTSCKGIVSSGLLHFIKYVFDSSTGKYVRVMWDNELETIENITVQKTLGAFNPSVSANVQFVGDDTTPTDIDLLHVIITANEP